MGSSNLGSRPSLGSSPRFDLRLLGIHPWQPRQTREAHSFHRPMPRRWPALGLPGPGPINDVNPVIVSARNRSIGRRYLGPAESSTASLWSLVCSIAECTTGMVRDGGPSRPYRAAAHEPQSTFWCEQATRPPGSADGYCAARSFVC